MNVIVNLEPKPTDCEEKSDVGYVYGKKEESVSHERDEVSVSKQPGTNQLHTCEILLKLAELFSIPIHKLHVLVHHVKMFFFQIE